MDEKFATQAQIENDTRAYKLQCAKFDEEVNTAKVPFIYCVSTCIAQNLILIPNFSQKLGFFCQNQRISFSTLHFDKIFMLQFEIFSTQRKMLKKLVKLFWLIKQKVLT
jgi:hypothetical protein